MTLKTTHRSALAALLIATAIAGATGCSSADPSIPVGAAVPQQSTAPTTPSNPGNPVGSGEKVAAVIDNSTGGTVALSDGTKLDVPAGALPAGVSTITVTSSTAAAPTEYSAVSPVYVFGPDGTVFLKPVKVSIPLTIAAGQSTDDLTVLWSRESGPGFDMVPTHFVAVDGKPGSYTAIGQVTHFSQGMAGQKFTVDPHPTKDPYADKP